MNELLKSKRFWIAAATVAAIVLKDKIPLSEDQIQQLVWAIGAWIVGESIRPVEPKPEASK